MIYRIMTLIFIFTGINSFLNTITFIIGQQTFPIGVLVGTLSAVLTATIIYKTEKQND